MAASPEIATRTRERAERIAELRAQGLGSRAIAERLGISMTTVQDLAKYGPTGKPRNRQSRKGEKGKKP